MSTRVITSCSGLGSCDCENFKGGGARNYIWSGTCCAVACWLHRDAIDRFPYLQMSRLSYYRREISALGLCLFAMSACVVDGAAPGAGGGSGGHDVIGSGGLVGTGSSSSGGTDGQSGGTQSGGSDSSGGSESASGGRTVVSGGSDGSGGNEAGSGGQGPTLPAVTDYSEQGPFDAVVENGQGPNDAYMIVRPDPLGADGFLHAPLIFGPGIGQEASVHTTMLRNFASHGFVVVGTPVLDQGPGGANNRQKMLDGLEWILSENESDGIYHGRLWTDHVVSMGFSVGGTSAVEIGGHESVLTVVSIHGHTASADLHGTMLQTTGTQDTIGMPLQQATYDMSEVPTFLATLTNAPHGYIEQNGGGEERPAIVAWMRYWIYGDTGAEAYFFGNSCTLCAAPWENPQRKNWP